MELPRVIFLALSIGLISYITYNVLTWIWNKRDKKREQRILEYLANKDNYYIVQINNKNYQARVDIDGDMRKVSYGSKTKADALKIIDENVEHYIAKLNEHNDVVKVVWGNKQ